MVVEGHLPKLRLGENRVYSDRVIAVPVEKPEGGREQVVPLGRTRWKSHRRDSHPSIAAALWEVFKTRQLGLLVLDRDYTALSSCARRHTILPYHESHSIPFPRRTRNPPTRRYSHATTEGRRGVSSGDGCRRELCRYLPANGHNGRKSPA